MATIGKVRAVFTASTSGLTSGVNQAAASMKKLQSTSASTAASMRSLVAIQGAQLFGSISSSVSGAVSSLVRMGQAQADVVDNASKMSARLGMTYGEFSGLSLAGELAGVSMETVAAAATKADVAFVKAAGGSATAVAAFNRIGLSVEQLNGMSASERFDAIASSIAALPTEAERAAAAVQIFGRAGSQLLPLFADGAAGIAQAREQAERLGLALTNAQGKDVEAMNDAFTLAGKAMDGIVQQVVAYLAPTINGIVTQFNNWVMDIGGKSIGQFIGDGILAGAEFLAGVADWMIAGLTSLWEYVSQVGVSWNGVWAVGQRIADYFSGVGRFWESVFKAIGSLLVGAIGRVMNAVGELMSKVPLLSGTGAGIEKAGESLMRTSTTLWSEAGSALEAAGENLGNAVFGRDAEQAGEALVGPVQTAFREWRDAADASAAAVDEAKRAPVDIKQSVEVVGIKEAVKGIDSRSKEGLAEMFRIMRGNGQNVQERIADGIQQIVENTDGIGEDGDLISAF